MTSLLSRAVRRARGPVRPDSGFSLIEAVVALSIATVMFLALATAAIFSIRTSLTGRQNQQAADFMTRALEDARRLDFAALGNDAVAVAGDPRVSACRCLDPGTGVTESIHLITGSGLNPHITTPSLATESNKTDYRVATYVTEPAGMNAEQVRRVTVVVSWKSGSVTKTKETSSLVAFARRGLPLPTFKLDAFTSLDPGTKVAGSTFAYGFKLVNQGAPDRWNITLSGTGASLPWKILVDAEQDNDAFNSATDTVQLADSSGDGIPDTGRVNPSYSFTFWLIYQSPQDASSGETTTTITATSFGQPTAADASKSQTVTTRVGSGGSTPTPTPSSTSSPPAATDCAWTSSVPVLGVPVTTGSGNAYNPTTWTLHNGTSGGRLGASTSSQSLSRMNSTGAYESTLYAYSSDQNALGGRTLPVLSASDASAPISLTDPKKYVDWQTTQLPNGTRVAGSDALLKIWVGGVNSSLNGLSLRLNIYGQHNTTVTSLRQLDFNTTTVCPGFAQLYVAVPVPASALTNGSVLGLRVVNIGSIPVRLAYDVAGSYDATFGIGVR